jgi:hypothetical protein
MPDEKTGCGQGWRAACSSLKSINNSSIVTHLPSDSATRLGSGLEGKALRAASDPALPWWIYVWSVRTTLNIGPAGRVPITQRLRMERPPGSRVVLCLHPDGHHSVLATQPDPQQKPVLLFTNRPK